MVGIAIAVVDEIAVESHQFLIGKGDDPHRHRRRAILMAHPEVRALCGRNPETAAWIVLVGFVQVSIAAIIGQAPFWVVFGGVYVVGAIVALSLWTLLHETAHDLVLRTTRANRILGIAAGLPLGLPTAASFRKFHLLHHRYQGDAVCDCDIASPWEIRLVGTSRSRKVLWLLALPLLLSLRAARMPGVRTVDRWSLTNMAVQLVFDLSVVAAFGWKALAYLCLANIFALGLHPLGGRWIQEHYLLREGQETSSCYGWVNRIVFNAGYHVEHHDFARVPWSRLPLLKAAAPEMYHGLRSYRSWTALLARFVLDPALGPGSRAIRSRSSAEVAQ